MAAIQIGSVWRRAVSLPASASAAQALAQRVAGPLGSAVIIEDEGHRAIGLLDDEALHSIPEQSLASVPITAVMRLQPAGWVVEATAEQSIVPVVMAMQQLGIGAVPVRVPGGQIAGIVLADDLEAALSQRPASPT